jgi:hypothetical protein
MKRIALLLALLAGFAQVGISEAEAQSGRISMEAAGNSYGILGINFEYSALPFLSFGVGASTCILYSDVHAFLHLLLPIGKVRPFIGASISGNYELAFWDTPEGYGYTPAVHLGVDWQTSYGSFFIFSIGIRNTHTWRPDYAAPHDRESSGLQLFPGFSMGLRI